MAVLEIPAYRAIQVDCARCGAEFTYMRATGRGGRNASVCPDCKAGPEPPEPAPIIPLLAESKPEVEVEIPRLQPCHPSDLAQNIDRRLRLRDADPCEISMADHIRMLVRARSLTKAQHLDALLELATDCLEEARTLMRAL